MPRTMLAVPRIIALAGLFGLLSLSAQAQEKRRNIYGHGGPLAPKKEYAELFTKARGFPVLVTAGLEPNWIDQAK